MPRNSPKRDEDKSIYQRIREEIGLTRAEASERLECISESRLEKIENGKTQIVPDDVLWMAEKYGKPELCNYYCTNKCPIGQKYVPRAEAKDLSQIVLDMLATLNRLNRQKETFVDITADGQIESSELEAFLEIQEGLDKIASVSGALKIWVDEKIASGSMDKSQFDRIQKKQPK